MASGSFLWTNVMLTSVALLLHDIVGIGSAPLIDFFISRSNRKKEMSISSAYQSPGCTRAEDQVNQSMTLYFSLSQSIQKV
jgi:hypothetical protein